MESKSWARGGTRISVPCPPRYGRSPMSEVAIFDAFTKRRRSKMTPGKFTRIPDTERAALSQLRQKAVKLLEDNVPVTGLTSNDATFDRLTGYNTTKLQETWKTSPGFTTCNAFGGNYALLLGAPPGC